jgi:hypothetical protein
MFTLAAEGKTNRKGLPNPFRLAVIADAHFDTVQLPCPPALLQQAALATAAPLGRLLGYQAHTAHPASITRPHTRPDRTYDRRASADSHEHSRTTAKRQREMRCVPLRATVLQMPEPEAYASLPPIRRLRLATLAPPTITLDASHRPCIARDRRTA